MIPTATNHRMQRLRGSRSRIAVVFLIMAFVLSGAVHEFFHMDVTAPAGRIVVSMSPIHPESNDQGVIAGHHCHGCFSVSLPNPLLLSVAVEPAAAIIPQVLSRASDLVPGIDTPPPKFLT